MTTHAALYRRRPGTTPRPGQIRAVWRWLVSCRVAYPDRPAYEGALAAVEWLVGLSNVPPVTAKTWRALRHLTEVEFMSLDEAKRVRDPRVKAPTNEAIADEINAAADMVEVDPNPDNRAYAYGAYALMTWWVGTGELPDELIPKSSIPRQSRSGAA